MFCINLILTFFVFSYADGQRQGLGLKNEELPTRECFLKTLDRKSCDNVKYPTIDGSCNNLLNPYAGATNMPFKRLLPPVYGDGKSTFRESIIGGPLPPARVISNLFNDDDVTNDRDSSINALHVTYGQFIAHDLTHSSPKTSNKDGSAIKCSCQDPHSSCINVPIPKKDPFFGYETKCISLMGTQTVEGCEGSPNEQLNALTAYLDAGNIYSSREILAAGLRDPDSDSGEIFLTESREKKTSKCPMMKNNGIFPSNTKIPHAAGQMINCQKHINSPACLAAGDRRVNENIGLSALNIAFTRHHNKIARRLKAINQHWDSDKVYLETRQIMIAIQQIIAYREYMEPLLGKRNVDLFDLRLSNEGCYYYGYDPTFDATLSNSFSTAANRYGHSQVGEHFFRLTSNYSSNEFDKVQLVDALFDQSAIVNLTDSSLIRGMLNDVGFKTDLQFVSDLRNRMFESPTRHGEDLLAINIQRGREHGLATYNQFREFCGFQKAFEWRDFEDMIKPEIVKKLASLYQHVDDVDLYVGGVSENLIDDGAVGLTFACIMAYQFRDIKKGDRFWHENPGQFTLEQLQELRKVTMSMLLCDNMDDMELVAPLAMQPAVSYNSHVSCSSLKRMKFDSWKELQKKEGGEWTRWFPIVDDSTLTTLQLLNSNEPDAICTGPMNQQVKWKSNEAFSVRFLCPYGSIKFNSFPNAKQGLRYYWTIWYDRDTPSRQGDDVESLLYLKMEQPDEICSQPLFVQAQTKDFVSALESGNIFESLSAKTGLVCKSKHQPDGKPCLDYRVRFYCPISFRNRMNLKKSLMSEDTDYRWTNWLNTGNPTRNDGDIEALGLARTRMYAICSRPFQIEARTIGSHVSAKKTGDVFKRYSVYHGVWCDNRDQHTGICHDYEVRYLCRTSFIEMQNARLLELN